MSEKEYAVGIDMIGTPAQVALALRAAADKISATGLEGHAKKAGKQFFYGINRTTIEVEAI